MAASVKIKALKDAIKSILKGADLDSLSAKKVRQKLEELFSVDFTERKNEIDQLTIRMITDGINSEDEPGHSEEDEEEDEKKPVVTKNKKTKASSKKSKASPHGTQNGKEKVQNNKKVVDSDDVYSSYSSDEELKPEPASKKTKKETKAANKPKMKTAEVRLTKLPDSNEEDEVDQEPSPKKKKAEKKPAQKAKTKKAAVTPAEVADDSDDDVVDDEELAKKLQEEEDMNIRTRRHPAKKPPAPRKPKEKKERKGTSMYSKPCILSEELADVLGEDRLSRHEIVKRMWDVMRTRNLQDPKNKQFMVCDNELQKLFGRKRVRMFGMMKWLTKHIRNPDDVE